MLLNFKSTKTGQNICGTNWTFRWDKHPKNPFVLKTLSRWKYSGVCYRHSLLITIAVANYFESPQMWVWPQLPFGGHPPPPRQLEDPPLQPSPSLPTLPLFPHPPSSFCNAPGWATWAGVGEAAHGGRGGPPSGTWGQTHISGHSITIAVVIYYPWCFYCRVLWAEHVHGMVAIQMWSCPATFLDAYWLRDLGSYP